MLTDCPQCIATLPHTPAFVPVVPTNVSLIPPVNTNSSYYDGMQRPNVDRSRVLTRLA